MIDVKRRLLAVLGKTAILATTFGSLENHSAQIGGYLAHGLK